MQCFAQRGWVLRVVWRRLYLQCGSVVHGTEGVNCEGCRAQGLKEKKLVESNLEKVDRLKPIAKELDCSLAQLALAWCIRNEHVSSVITGATSASR